MALVKIFNKVLKSSHMLTPPLLPSLPSLSWMLASYSACVTPCVANYPEVPGDFTTYYNNRKPYLKVLYSAFLGPPKRIISQRDYVLWDISVPFPLKESMDQRMIALRICVEDTDVSVFPAIWQSTSMPTTLMLCRPIQTIIHVPPPKGAYVLYIGFYLGNKNVRTKIAYSAVLIDSKGEILRDDSDWLYASWPAHKVGIYGQFGAMEYGLNFVKYKILVGEVPKHPDVEVRCSDVELVTYMINRSYPPPEFESNVWKLKKMCAAAFGLFKFSFVYKEGNIAGRKQLVQKPLAHSTSPGYRMVW